MVKEQRPVPEIAITLPGREDPTPFRVDNPRCTADRASCSVRKDAGDDPDVTDGLDIHSEVRLSGSPAVAIRGGAGVGAVTRPGLQVEVGRPAINPVPLRMIEEAVAEFFPAGVTVTISVPGGEKVAEKTFNPRLGIRGGISIIGTTGIVKPFSEPALKTSILLELDVLHASGAAAVFLAPGNIGKKAAEGICPACAPGRTVMISNFLGDALKHALPLFERVFLVGHPGKLLKVLNGDYDTHSRRSRPALPLARERMEAEGIEVEPGALGEVTTVEGVIALIGPRDRLLLCDGFARDIERRIAADFGAGGRVAVALTDMSCSIVGRGDLMRRWEDATCPG
jgi:cobalt-precorrin-5B (C1)-methyltransferase